MGRHKMQKGVCRLCGINTDLSYEHVPPRVAFNRKTKFVLIDFEEYLKSPNALDNPPKGKINQGGIGYNSFCIKCNSFLGSKYVPAYSIWAEGGMFILNKQSEYGLHGYTIKGVQPLNILKQIISMIIAINDDWFLDSFPELISFVKDPYSNELPSKFRVFMYLTNAERFRYMHYNVHGNLTNGEIIPCSEIAFPPYGYVLAFDFEGNINYLNEITDFKKFQYNHSCDLKMINYQLPTHMPFALDYRSEKKIVLDIDKSLSKMKENYNKKSL